MIKIAHFADVHVRNIDRHEEYKDIFLKIYKKLSKLKPDRIVISGDLFDNYIEISNEGKIIAGDFLTELSKIALVIITRGNHDIRKKNVKRVDSVEAVIKLMKNPKIKYINKTGFTNDGDLKWVVYDHIDKNNDPWLNKKKDPNKIHIGLFHDPIQDSSTDTGSVFTKKTYKSINHFKNNDFVFFGDIHKKQFFRKNKSAAYCGSTIQQDFGENIDGHGFLFWEINSATDFKVEHHHIDNDYTFVNLYIDESVDYDNLNLNAPISKHMDIKVHWKDFSSNINTENQKKITDYIEVKFGTTKVKFDKVFIYTDIVSSKMLSESLDLSDTATQTTIIKEFLEEQKYDKKDIELILKIDEIINSRLTIKPRRTNISWSIDRFWFTNFKSYGDDNMIDWEDNDGIYQIHGVNKQGKTTILDAITYILYGKTTTTLTSEKHGDNRYINNKRDLDYCIGGAVLDIDGEKFTIQRKTERKWNRAGTGISSCPTTLDFYDDVIISDDTKITGEVKTKTQEDINLVLGELKDFVRLSFTNADNLNEALSLNRSVFMDNIIRDAGYDIFETKLDEFKKYKKELSEEKLVVDISISEKLIETLENNNKELKDEIDLNKLKKIGFDKVLYEHNKNRDNLNKKLNDIDLELLTFDEDLNLDTIDNYNGKIKEAEIQGVILDREIKSLPEKFDSTKLDELKIKLKETNSKISERKEELANIKNLIDESDNKKEIILDKIEQLKNNEINKLKIEINNNNLEIEIIKNNKNNVVNDAIRNVTSNIQEIELEKSGKNSDMKLLQKDGVFYKKANEEYDIEIKELEESTSCPTCGRAYDKTDPEFEEHINHLNDRISAIKNKKNENSTKLKELMIDFKKIKSLLPEYDDKISILEELKSDIKSGVFSDEIKTELKKIGSTKSIKEKNIEIDTKIENIKNNDFSELVELQEKINVGNTKIRKLETDKTNNEQFVVNLKSELVSFNIDGIEVDINSEETKKDNYELRKQKVSKKENLLLTVENFKFKIIELEKEIENYKNNKTKIEDNKKTQLLIDEIDEKISLINDDISNLLQANTDKEKDILIKENEITDTKNKIKKYLKQKKSEELLKEYQKCISRDGIPTYLLKKSTHLINNELNDLLSNVDFTLFLDENLVLRMSSDDRLDVSQNAIESSGMERTFCSLALKMALRQVNINSKCELIVMDEIMGKLIDTSIKEFIDFIDVIKSKVKKLIIIEHVHPINYDTLITVKKDEKTLVSSLVITE